VVLSWIRLQEAFRFIYDLHYKDLQKKHIFGSPRCKSHFPAIFNGRFASQCGRLPPLRHGIHPPVMEIEGWFYGNLSNKHDKRGGLMGLSWEFKLMEYEWEIVFFFQGS
jgi:hypothetical protein